MLAALRRFCVPRQPWIIEPWQPPDTRLAPDSPKKGLLVTDLVQTIETDVTTGLKDAGAFFAGVLAKLQSAPNISSTTVSTVQTAANSAGTAASDISAAIPALAKEAANLVLSLIPGNSPYVPLEDAFLDQVIAELTAAKSTSASAS